MTTVTCSGVECGKELPVAGDWFQLDVPNEGFRLFCNLGCLRTWINWSTAQEVNVAIQEESHDDDRKQ